MSQTYSHVENNTFLHLNTTTVTLELFSDVMNQGLLHAANIKCHIKLMFFTSFSGSHYVPDGD